MTTIAEIGKDCVGCRSCEQSCPKKCITIKENNEGFLYPVVQEESCVQCGLCLKKCPVSKPYENLRETLATYALREKDKTALFDSASGGASDVLTEAVLRRGGYVYGAAYDDTLSVKHIEASDESGRKKIQSSKYVQSDLKDCFTKAKHRLEEGKIVLFTGTPCQIAGLYAFLGKEYENLYTLDLICHGVPSPKFFKKYLAWQGERMGGKVIYFNFRSKEKRGWGTQYLLKTKTKIKIKIKTKTLSLDKYGKHFMAGDCYRESCYRCRYANIHHSADITVGDFWGVEQCHPEFFSNLGVSTIIVNSQKGKTMMAWVEETVVQIRITIDEALTKQHNLVKATSRPNSRNEFYKNIDKVDFLDELKVGMQAKERIKSVIPKEIVKMLKRYIG